MQQAAAESPRGRQAVDEAQRVATEAEFLAWQQRAQQAAAEVLEERTMLWWHRHMQNEAEHLRARGSIPHALPACMWPSGI